MVRIKTQTVNNNKICCNIINKNSNITANIVEDTNNINTNISPTNVNVFSNVDTNDSRINSNIVSNTTNLKSTTIAYPSATEEKKGIIRIAKEEEVIEGISRDTVVTPYALKRLASSDKFFVFEQGISSDTWRIMHNLEKRPSVTVVDSSDSTIIPDEIIYVDNNYIILNFLSAFSGKAYLN